jgi:hypothetical protein
MGWFAAVKATTKPLPWATICEAGTSGLSWLRNLRPLGRGGRQGNGYVSCTLSVTTADGVELHAIECSTFASFNGGCRKTPLTTIR